MAIKALLNSEYDLCATTLLLLLGSLKSHIRDSAYPSEGRGHNDQGEQAEKHRLTDIWHWKPSTAGDVQKCSFLALSRALPPPRPNTANIPALTDEPVLFTLTSKLFTSLHAASETNITNQLQSSNYNLELFDDLRSFNSAPTFFARLIFTTLLVLARRGTASVKTSNDQ